MHATLQDALAARLPATGSQAAYRSLSTAYRGGAGTSRQAGAEDALAYAAARAPATGAAVARVLAEVRRLRPDFSPVSLLDLGAGPGTAMWSAAQAFPGLVAATAVERSPAFAALGRDLAQSSEHPAVRAAGWLRSSLPTGADLPGAELVTAAYLLVELDEATVARVVAQAWAAATDTLVLVEPGTPSGFARILAARTQLLAGGATALAPCPDDAACPLAEGPSWCHFAVRLARTEAHRAAKGGSLPFEDEKHSYLVATRNPAPTRAPRLLAMPAVHKGHVRLRLCTAPTVTTEVVARSAGPSFRDARALVWGDAWGS